MAKKKYWETKEFIALNKEWKKKLKAKGFDDIEENESENLIQPEIIIRPEFKTQYIGGIDYYQFCHQILREYKFKKSIHFQIFELHTEGRSASEIEIWIKKNTFFKLTERAINYLVQNTIENFIKGKYEKKNPS